MKLLLLLGLFAVTSAAECCNQQQHTVYEKGNAKVGLCIERGGVPITEPVRDEGGHDFETLVGCSFPCDVRGIATPKVEK